MAGIDLSTYEAGLKALRGRSPRRERWAHAGRELSVLAHARLVLREPVRWHPLQGLRGWVSGAGRLALLAVDVTHVAVDAPSERTVHRPRIDDGVWSYQTDDFEVVRRWRDGRWGWLDVERGKWYPSVAVAGAATITAAVGGGSWGTGSTWVGGVAPTAADDVLLTITSGAVTVSAGSLCRSLDTNGYASTLSGSGDLNIGDASGGACLLISGTFSGTWTTVFKSTSNNGGTGWNVTSTSKVFPGAVTFDGVGGKWVLTDNFSCGTATLTVTNGGFFGNGQTVTCLRMIGTGAATRTVDITNCTITCSGTLASWNFATTTNLTFVSTGSTINQTANSYSFDGGGLSYGSVVHTNGDNNVTSGAAITGANTFVNYTRTGDVSKLSNLSLAANQIVTGTCTLTANSLINRSFIFSNVRGTARTITAATLVCTNVIEFMDITGAGAATWTTGASGATSFGDCGGNSGITMTAAATQTATGTASFAWSTHGWTSRVPLPQDDVVIPNAFVAGRVITVDMPRLGASISRAGGSGSVSFTNTVANESYGSLLLVTGDTLSGTNAWTLAGRDIHTITSAAATFSQSVTISGPGGAYTLQDAFNNGVGSLSVLDGTFNDGGQTVAAVSVASTSGRTRTITMTAAWSITSTATANVWNVAAAGLTLNATGSTITITNTSANTRTFVGGGQTYGTLTYTVAGSTGQLTITGNNTWTGGGINFADVTNARTLVLTGTTQTFTGTATFNVNGTAGKLMSVTGGTVSKASGYVSCVYLSLTSSTATGGALWFAGVNSTDVSGNSGWLFTAPAFPGTQASSTSTAFGGLPAVAIPGSQTSETDTGVGGAAATTAIGAQASETDTANGGVVAVAVLGAQGSETDTGVAGSQTVAQPGTQAAETDTAAGGLPAGTVTGTQASETDTANVGLPASAIAGAQVSETDTAVGGSVVGSGVSVSGTQADETDTGVGGTSAVVVGGAQGSETDTGVAGSTVATVAGTQANETDTANSGTPTVTVASTQASETDTGIGGSVFQGLIVAGSQASESDSGIGGVPTIAVTGSQRTETDTGVGGSFNETQLGTQASESDTGVGGVPRALIAGAQAAETDTGIVGSTQITLVGGQAITVETVTAGTLAVRVAGVLATEQDSGFSGSSLGGVTPAVATFALSAEGVSFGLVASDVDFTLEAVGASFTVEAES